MGLLCENSPRPSWVDDPLEPKDQNLFSYNCEDLGSTFWIYEDLPSVDVDGPEPCKEKCSQIMKTDTGTYTEGIDKDGDSWNQCVCEQGTEQCTVCATGPAPDKFLGQESSAYGHKATAAAVTVALVMLVSTFIDFVVAS